MDNIPSKEQIQTALDNAYAFAKTVQGGKNASYIPALAQVPSDLLAIAAVTVNGDVLTAGSADRPFAIESISKAFNLAYVMDLIAETTADKNRGGPHRGAVQLRHGH